MPTEPATAPRRAAPSGPAGSQNSSAKRIAAVAGVALATAVALWVYGDPHNFFDLRIYMAAMHWWADGHDLYDYAQPDRVQGHLYFTYPPFAALLLRPFAEVPLLVTIVVFTAVTVLAIGATTWWLVSPLADRHGWPRWYAVGLALPLVFLIEPVRETVTFGQINMLLVALILGDLLVAVPRKWRLAGVGIGLATALKLFPGIFIVYLLVTRRWRTALVASVAAAGATLLAAAVAPRASWQFWTSALWATERVGRTDYTGNQSMLGLLSRLVAPDQPNRLIWLAGAAVIAGYGLWRAARASDEVTGIALTGLVAALISPLTWPHHVYWFVPALVVLVGAVLATDGRRQRIAYGVLGSVTFAVAVFGVVSFIDWGVAFEPTDTVGLFLLRNAYVLISLALLAALPLGSARAAADPEVPVYTT